MLFAVMETKILEDIGFTPGEIKAYLALIRLGPSSTGPIAKESGLSRSKLYFILDKLEKKGMVSHAAKNKVLYFQAETPKKIREYLDAKEEQFRKQREGADKIIPQLEIMQKTSGEKLEAHIYKGSKGLIAAHEHYLDKLKRNEEYLYLSIPRTNALKYNSYWQKDHLVRIDKGIKCRVLYNLDVPRHILDNRNSFKDAEAKYMPLDIKSPV